MGLFDQLLKTAERAVSGAVKQKLNEVVSEELGKFIPQENASSANANSEKNSPYDVTPDLPRNFPYNNGWICVNNADTDDVISALGLKNPREANWKSGFKAIDENFLKKVFVVKVGGYVLAIGYCPFGVKRTVKEELDALNKAAERLSDMSCFATQSTVDLHVWAKYENGKMTRGYGWLGESGEVYLNEGTLTAEEISLGYTDFITNTDCDWDTARFPNTDNVQALAGAWGILPDLSNIDNPEPCTGFVCEL